MSDWMSDWPQSIVKYFRGSDPSPFHCLIGPSQWVGALMSGRARQDIFSGTRRRLWPSPALYPTEYGGHVADLREVTRSASPVLLTTTCPLVVNELRPEEVTIIADRDGQPVLCRLDHTIAFKQRIKIYALGELWLSYCDGREERKLIPREPGDASEQTLRDNGVKGGREG